MAQNRKGKKCSETQFFPTSTWQSTESSRRSPLGDSRVRVARTREAVRFACTSVRHDDASRFGVGIPRLDAREGARERAHLTCA